MNYSIHGPFRLPRQLNGLIDRKASSRNRFWRMVDDDDNDLSSACGCYIFAMRAGRGIKPFYVGLAEMQSFDGECFSANKINIYNDVLGWGKRGSPMLFLIAKRTTTNRFVRPSNRHHDSNSFLESMLIGSSLQKNANLMNVQKTKFLKRMVVPGFINSPRRRPTRPETNFRIAIE